MTTRQWCLRTLIALMLGLAYVNPVAAQVDPGDNPNMDIANAQDVRAFGACLEHPTLRPEIEACFAAGPLRSVGFSRFFTHGETSIYLGNFTFGNAGNGLRLGFVLLSSPSGSQIGFSTSLTTTVGDRIVAADVAELEYLAWVFKNQRDELLQRLEQDTVVGIEVRSTGSAQDSRRECVFRRSRNSIDSFQLNGPQRQFTVTASHSRASGYFDVRWN